MEAIYDALRIVFAFAVVGFMTWLWSIVYNQVMEKYVKPLINRELNAGPSSLTGVIA